MPDYVSNLPEESVEVFNHCLGRDFPISDITEDDQYVLDVSDPIDKLCGGYMNDIRVESTFLEKVKK
ncbi:MAG: hypothetical protein AAF984_05035 [Verrucomicrobiota bacterium]